MKIILIFIALLLVSCNKTDEASITLLASYTINIQNDRLISYSKYDRTANVLILEATYVYQEDRVTEIVTQYGRTYSKRVYLMGTEFADESFDTIFYNDNDQDIYHHKYFHLEGKLVRDEFEYKFLTDDSLTVYNKTYEYSYSDDGNMIELTKTIDLDYDSTCDDIYTYNDSESKFDVYNFASVFTGEISNNLRKTKIYDSGCPGGPSWTYAQSTYSYEINEDGYVELMTETYKGGDSFKVVTKTTFEYNIE